jgi:hypothetical protein
MSEMEDAVATVVRLLQKGVHIVKEDSSLAQVYVSREWCDRELFKNYDGQVTVGLAESQDQKMEMSGRLRKRLGFLRVSVWAADKAASSDSGRLMRGKMMEEVNRTIRENRNTPNVTEYGFTGLGYPTGDPHKAFQAGASTEPAPSDGGWTQLASADYEKIRYSDNNRFSKSHNINSEYALMLFRFKLDSRENVVKRVVLNFEGYGTAPSGNGVTVKAWNHIAGAWQQTQTGSDSDDEAIAITISESLTDFIDDDGYVWLLARTTNPSDGVAAATLYCDYASCIVAVNGITYVDVASFRDADLVEVKPFIYHTEFTLKSWSFETVGV